MLSETLTAGIEKYRIGQKIRALRQAKKLGLAELAAHTGLSPALISKIERSHIHPTLPTLLRIAMVFGVGLDYFFSDDGVQPLLEVVRKADRLRMPGDPAAKAQTYFFESLNFPVNRRKLDAYLASFPPDAAPSQPHAHAGTEFIYVISGSLELAFDTRKVTLLEGDAVHFDSTHRHTYAQANKSGCTAVVVTVPP